MPRAAVLATLIAALLVPASATAAARYASPAGGMVPGCSQVSPCSLDYAITAASPGDEVVVTSGQYTVGATIETETPLWIHGQPGTQKPRIFAADKSVLKSFAPQRISDLSLEATNNADGVLFVPADGTSLERLEIFARGADSLGLRPGNNFTMTDTLVFAENSIDATGVFIQGTGSGTVQLRNDTIVAEGSNAVGLSVFMAAKNSSLTVEATNVIASGTRVDALAQKYSEATGSTVAARLDQFNLARSDGEVTSNNGQTAPPQFFPPNPRGFQQAPTSPTIDAGVNSPQNGEGDVDGRPRALPGHRSCETPDPPAITDIGAYEFDPGLLPCVPRTEIVRFKLRKRLAKVWFSFAGTQEPVTFRCRLDRRRWSPCISPRVYKHLKPRRHVIKVRAYSPIASDQTPAKRKFRVKPPARSKGSARR